MSARIPKYLLLRPNLNIFTHTLKYVFLNPNVKFCNAKSSTSFAKKNYPFVADIDD